MGYYRTLELDHEATTCPTCCGEAEGLFINNTFVSWCLKGHVYVFAPSEGGRLVHTFKTTSTPE